MKTYIIILASLFFFVTVGSAQAPGYLGKHFIISLNVLGSSAIKGPTAQNKGSNLRFLFNDGTLNSATESIGFNLNYQLNASYIFANKLAIGLSASFAKTGLNLEEVHNSTPFGGFYDHFYTLNYTMVGVDITSSSFLAPIGLYGKLGLGFVSGKGKESDLNVRADPRFNAASILTAVKPMPYIKLGFGWKNVFFDRIILDLGFEANLTTNRIAYLNSYSTELQEYYDLASKSRIARHMLINAKVGLGFLIF